MELLSNLMMGLGTSLQPTVLMFCLLGVVMGTFIGVLPGIGPLAAISLLLPITFHIDPTSAIVMLAGVYYGSEYGGSTASILLNIPGTTANAVTCLDGYPMAQNGKAGVALFITTIASLGGGIAGVLALVFCAPLILKASMMFGAAEYVALMIFGLVASTAVSTGSPLKALAMVVLGLLLSTWGIDLNTGRARFDFGVVGLMDGLSLVMIAMGIFGVTEIMKHISSDRNSTLREKITLRSMLPSKQEMRQSGKPIVRGSLIGVILGALPGTGPAIASYVSYAVERKVAKDPSRFGKGAIEGISAPEASNNAAAQAAFIPTLTLGIPGSATMAVMMGALIIHGIQPGPTMMVEQPSLFWGLIASFFIGNLILVILNIPMIGVWVSMLNVPSKYLFPGILAVVLIGAYGVHYSTFDIFVLAVIGVIGYGMYALRFEPAPLLLGFVLGPLLEQNFRRAMLLSRGDLSVFIERPLSLALLLITLAILVLSIWGAIRSRRQQRMLMI